MLLVAHAIRPPQFANTPAYPRTMLLALAADTRQRMWTIVIASFLALLALAAAAIVLNCGARRATDGESSSPPDTLAWWATGGMFLALAPAVVVAAVMLGLPMSLLANLSLAVFAMAGAMEGVILSATALRRSGSRPPGSPLPRRDLRQLGARVGLVVWALLLLIGFVVTAFAAQFLAAFLLLLVY